MHRTKTFYVMTRIKKYDDKTAGWNAKIHALLLQRTIF